MVLRYLLLLGFLALIPSALETANCKKVECGAESNQCTQFDGTTLKVGSCNSGYQCPGQAVSLLNDNDNDYASHQCVATTTSNNCDGEGDLATGRTCCANADCASGNCSSSKKCVGVDSGAACTKDEACKPGYICSSDVCTQITKSNGDSCEKSDECPIGSGCNNSVCTKLYSLSTGDSAEKSKFCKSGYRHGDRCDEVIVKINGVEIDEPYECTIGQVCVYERKYSGSTFEQKDCPCSGKEGATSSYCWFPEQTKGDNDFIYERLQFDESDCSGDDSHEFVSECGQIDSDDYDDIVKLMAIRDFWPLYKSGAIDDCAENLRLFDPDFSDDDGAEALILGALIALMVQLGQQGF